ncbi:hypothetical protein OOU_Y34scaffold00735g2 [Pyricularia oryzae Y34]|uniref:Uncharacterized protein n=2 Tax=Pyricularia oryzae TaxID=318829 RepID=A0AA97NRL5_PYRO3|nr:hypothetical protein OOU_Y34scaffold00735g2 [Pyricularia oryzae Y34]
MDGRATVGTSHPPGAPIRSVEFEKTKNNYGYFVRKLISLSFNAYHPQSPVHVFRRQNGTPVCQAPYFGPDPFHSDSVPSGEIPGVPRVKAACIKALRTIRYFLVLDHSMNTIQQGYRVLSTKITKQD